VKQVASFTQQILRKQVLLQEGVAASAFA